jgi:hypothetical protein
MPFGAGFGGDHDAAAFASIVAEVVDQRGARVGSAGAGNPVRAGVPGDPLGVDFPEPL